MAPASRIGVYVCHCGINIAATVDIPAVVGYTSGLPGVMVCRDYTYMCSEPGQAMIKKDIQELELNRVVVASCSPRMHEPTFRAALVEAGLNPYCLEMANIREQCSWVHASGEATTLKAMQLVASAVAKASRLEPLQVRSVPVTPAAVVVGGGVAGLQASLDIADAGFAVHLIEREASLGGYTARLHRTFPTLDEMSLLVADLIERAGHHPRIHVHTGAEVTAVNGYVGNFRVQFRQGEEQREIASGALVIATGFQTFDARRKPELGYGVYPGVITTEDVERFGSGPIQIDGKQPRKVVFIQCVGSRDQTVGVPYCSRVCCMVAAKQAQLIRERYPDAQVSVFYMDVRAFGKNFEKFYDQARDAGVIYRRGNPSEIIRRGNQLVVRAEDTLTGEPVEVETDLVVLAVGMAPRADADSLASLLKLSRSADGFFLEAHPKLRPVETALAGVYLAGCCLGPKDIADSLAQGRAAAASAMIPLMKAQVQVEAAISFINEELCAGCGQCASICAYSALALHPVRNVMTVNPVLCQGCGACVATCPSGAIDLHQFSFDQVLAQAQAISDQPTRSAFRSLHKAAV